MCGRHRRDAVIALAILAVSDRVNWGEVVVGTGLAARRERSARGAIKFALEYHAKNIPNPGGIQSNRKNAEARLSHAGESGASGLAGATQMMLRGTARARRSR
jgi:hypothetical protein